MKNSSKIFVVLSIILFYVISSCHGYNPFAKTVVTVTNNISPQTTLTISCRSKDDDLGEHLLLHGQAFLWKFRPSWFRTTLFTCKFLWNNNVKWFDTYRSDRDQGHCYSCNWSINADSACISGNFNKKFDRCYPWN
ncbi:S-protein 29 [Arabidopsis thaliana]|uniref:S-protein homolog 29 n=1 Tax=Arabidopsis thaliana TaxID=3702 RepID=SPH29_ARATH|nr:RecName: Full=S-protein homolog 29; Flags: Precursor [Arabidopsis thaliana]